MRGGMRIPSQLLAVAIAAPLLSPRVAGAICREVIETGSEPAILSPDQEVLLIRRTDVPAGCADPDGGAGGAGNDAGAGAAGDAGAGAAGDAGADAGAGADASAGLPADAGSCQTRQRDTVTMIVQPRFSTGPDGSTFALLMVTPRPPVVDTAPLRTFEELARQTAPDKIVHEHTVEDPALGYQCQDPKYKSGSDQVGCGSWDTSGGWSPPDLGGGAAADAGSADGYVPVQQIGTYEVAVLTAADTTELGAWLDQAGYRYGQSDLDALAPYLELGWIVTAVRVEAGASLDGGLDPLSFTYEGDELRLPLGIAHQPIGGHTAIKVYLAAEGRYELPGATLGYAGWTASMGQEPLFLTASVLDTDLSRTADDDPVAARAATDTPYRESYVVDREVRIPSSDCPSGPGGDGGCGCVLEGPGSGELGSLLLAAMCAVFIFRRRSSRPR